MSRRFCAEPAGRLTHLLSPRGQRRPRRALFSLMLLGLLVASACGPGGDRSTGSRPDPTVSVFDEPVAVEPFAPSANALALMDTASVLARDDGEHSYTIFVNLPGENLAETTYTLDPTPRELAGLAETGTALRAFDFSNAVTARGFEWRLEYVVPLNSFPPDALAGRGSGEPPRWLDHVVRALLNPRPASASDGSGVQVVVEGVVKEAGVEAASQILGSELTTFEDAIGNIADALETSAWYGEQMRRLEQLRRCAEHPTNPLTRRMYEESPAEKDRILREVRRTELDIQSNTIVRFVGAMNGQASGLVRWLGFVVGPATAWADARLVRYTEDQLRELERYVGECEESEHRAFLGTYTSPYGNKPELPIAGVSCTAALDGEWAFLSSGNPEYSPVDRYVLEALVAGSGERPHGVWRTAPGAGVEVVGEAGFTAVLQLTADSPPKMRVTITNRHRDGVLIGEGEHELWPIEVSADFCGDLSRSDRAP